MNNIKISQSLVSLPLVHPFQTSFGTQDKKFAIIIKLEDEEGNVGWGETVADPFPGYAYETMDTTWIIQERYLIPSLKQQFQDKFPTIEDIHESFMKVRGHNFAKAGLESAYWSLVAERENKSLKEIYGATKKKIPTGVSIGIQPRMDDLLKRIAQFLEKGYQRIKIKIKPGWDLEVVEKIRKQFGDIRLMVDANSAYSLSDRHVEIFKKMDRFELMMIEQPLAYDDMLDHKILQSKIDTPICLDESIHSVRHAEQAIEFECARIINIKPARVGGYYNAKTIAEKLGKDKVWLGGMLEMGIGRMHNIFVQAKEEFTIPGDTSGSDRYFKEDIVDPPVAVDESGYIEVPEGINLGVKVKEDFILSNTIKHAEY
ncbi:MAG: o-succinylbenzoate synthase [Methanobacteriota archaeon]|nr:MAG: o-succinylbenzoate synthase [Euryarchaeota archaeon]